VCANVSCPPIFRSDKPAVFAGSLIPNVGQRLTSHASTRYTLPSPRPVHTVCACVRASVCVCVCACAYTYLAFVKREWRRGTTPTFPHTSPYPKLVGLGWGAEENLDLGRGKLSEEGSRSHHSQSVCPPNPYREPLNATHLSLGHPPHPLTLAIAALRVSHFLSMCFSCRVRGSFFHSGNPVTAWSPRIPAVRSLVLGARSWSSAAPRSRRAAAPSPHHPPPRGGCGGSIRA